MTRVDGSAKVDRSEAEVDGSRSGDVGPFESVGGPAADDHSERSVKHSDVAPTETRTHIDEPHILPPEPSWVQFDGELEQVCRIAAQVGGSQPAPISYTALIIALLWHDGRVSDWFRNFVGSSKGIDQAAIFRSKNISSAAQREYVGAAHRGALPSADPLYSRSTRNLLDQAARIAREVALREPDHIVLGTRHLVAAYVFRNPSDHVDQVRGWGFDVEEWRSSFRQFMLNAGKQSDEDWSRLGRPITVSAPMIGSFTADDPSAPKRDLLDIEGEAKAFARIAAAKDVTPPLAIGVFGEWGSGKTFFMRLIHDNVRRLTEEAGLRRDAKVAIGPFLPDIVQIRFNAWHYIESNLWASLVEYIFAELEHWLKAKTGKDNAGAEHVFDRLATAQRLKLDALDNVIARRTERSGAEQRAAQARREYEEAVVRASKVGAGTYARAFMATLLDNESLKDDVEAVGNALGVSQLAANSDRVLDVLEEARSEAGRARLVMRAGAARLGSSLWIASIVLVLIGLPVLTLALRDGISSLLEWPRLQNLHETALGISSALAGLAAWGGVLIRRASGALTKIDAFDQRLRELSQEEVTKAKESSAAKAKDAAEEDVRKRKQALEAAERALAETEARLAEARNDFESASARSRLNAFIRAKATDGDYAKYLGIIAAIRRDFAQLATLMGAANDGAEERAQSERLAQETQASVIQFLERLTRESDVRLTVGEVRNLLMLLEPGHAAQLLSAADRYRAKFSEWLGGDAALAEVEKDLAAVNAPLPTFSRIILYIDDLDRCPPNVVVDVLQAVHLLLCFPLFTVVVAVDARWVSHALHERFPNLLGETGAFSGMGGDGLVSGASSHDYLEKIFQIPYWVRPVDAPSAQRYVNRLVEPDVRRVAVAAEAQSRETGSSSQVEASARASQAAHGANVGPRPQPDQARPSVSPSTAPSEAAVGLELTRWEGDALERFAPLIGATPRRLIRFVNLYRLIKTGLEGAAQQRLVGERGESDVYRALIVQLAIVTGAPNAAAVYFRLLAQMQPDDTLTAMHDLLEKDAAFQDVRDHEIVLRVMQEASGWPGAALRVADLRLTAPTARRFSFTAWKA